MYLQYIHTHTHIYTECTTWLRMWCTQYKLTGMHTRGLVSDVFFGFRSCWFVLVLALFSALILSFQVYFPSKQMVNAIENIFFQFFFVVFCCKKYFSCINVYIYLVCYALSFEDLTVQHAMSILYYIWNLCYI